MKRLLLLIALTCLNEKVHGGPVLPTEADGSPALSLASSAQVTGSGVFLQDVLAETATTFTNELVAPAPAIGRALLLTRQQVRQSLAKQMPESLLTNWAGPAQVRITRKTRKLEEADLKEMLTATLQRDLVRTKGELEIRLTRPWTAVTVPDEPLTLKILEVPNSGVSSSFIARFEVQTERESFGPWQAPLQARVWRDVLVARSTQPRGRLLAEADLATERRDILALRDALAPSDCTAAGVELAEDLTTGSPLTLRSLKLRPVVRRGKVLDAVVQQGPLSITARVEALEDGLPGQTIRLRNPKSKREFNGKVQNEQTVLVSL
jgi:flagellar basal body P-ring formation protein FlgA